MSGSHLLTADDVRVRLGISRSAAFALMRRLSGRVLIGRLVRVTAVRPRLRRTLRRRADREATRDDDSRVVDRKMTSNDEPTEPYSGPTAYANWRAALRGAPAREGLEVLVYGDACATGGHWTLGPYEVINTIAGVVHDLGLIAPPLALRAWIHLGDAEWHIPLDKTDESRFHGTHMMDELAALLALGTGRRLRAASDGRYYKQPGHAGDPRAATPILVPTLPARGYRRLPRQAEAFGLTEDLRALLAGYPELPSKDAVGLVRAARSYRDALWIGEAHPDLAWLLLVAAVEAAINTKTRAAPPLDVLRDVKPDVAAMVAAVSDSSLRDRLAAALAPTFKAAGKFVAFLSEHRPRTGPEPRAKWGALAWEDDAAMREAFAAIYERRSRALHEAVAVPPPMCEVPRISDDAVHETTDGLATGTLGGIWRREDTPMLLHAFEFIVRESLLDWWRSLKRETPAQ